MNVVSLFSGCGGLDYGFEKAGFNVIFFNDSDSHCCTTLRLNKKENVIEFPIEQVSTEEVKKIVGSSESAIDILVGGPPCQPFSKSAYWSKGDTLRMDDPRTDTLDDYFRFIEELRPKVFLLENVHGLNYNGKEEGFQYILKRISEINSRHNTNYLPSWRVLNVADYGVPQLRVRFFLIAERAGRTFVFPQPTYAATKEIQQSLFGTKAKQSYVTAWEAIGHIPDDKTQRLKVGGKWADLLPSIPEGENYLWHTDRKGGLPLFGWRARYWSFLLKLAKVSPSWTIQAQPGSAIGPFHWKNRKLSWQEMAAIQTFPQEFKIKGPRAEIQRQIGNAVPSLMAEVLARAIAEQFFGKEYHREFSLTIPRKKYIPPPEEVESVPKKYHHLIGTYAPHPGTGKGISYKKSSGQQGHAPDRQTARRLF
jgi:DNA (cytosine-5)-methyltransferase 1